MYRGKLSVGRTLHYCWPNSSKACGQGLYYNHEDMLQFFSFSGYHRKKQKQPTIPLKNGMPTGLSISLFEMPAQTKEEKYVV